jgi:hypothetical protein
MQDMDSLTHSVWVCKYPNCLIENDTEKVKCLIIKMTLKL